MIQSFFVRDAKKKLKLNCLLTKNMANEWEIVQFKPSDVMSMFNQYDTVIPIARLQVLTFVFSFSMTCHDEFKPASLFDLVDGSIRVFIYDKLALLLPMLFCPCFAGTIGDGFGLLQNSISLSIHRILQRRADRQKNDIAKQLAAIPSKNEIMSQILIVMARNLKIRFSALKRLEHFLCFDVISTMTLIILPDDSWHDQIDHKDHQHDLRSELGHDFLLASTSSTDNQELWQIGMSSLSSSLSSSDSHVMFNDLECDDGQDSNGALVDELDDSFEMTYDTSSENDFLFSSQSNH
ncbi:hypothetical protein V1514DRAFT_60716 [Lipomyces japonicus]|uniref:uncharacterized protein n=1 Tax=Lipomyces japonicus TaxID=56871 RepID=UPI0034CFEB8E